MTEESSPEAAKPKRKIRRSFVIVTIAFFAVLLLFSHDVNSSKDASNKYSALIKANVALTKETSKLTKENAARIRDIQASRTASCRQTYSGIREVFKPFIPSKPTNVRQAEVIEKFNATIDRLKAGCIKQTKPKPKPKVVDGQ